ncbi:hypothetical protein KA005_80305, partial [bacterium]|nr:hypothetical protein [bacterium]
ILTERHVKHISLNVKLMKIKLYRHLNQNGGISKIFITNFIQTSQMNSTQKPPLSVWNTLP